MPELQKIEKSSRGLKKWVVITAVAEILIILLMCPYAVYVLNPGISDAAAGFAWMEIWPVGAVISVGIIIFSATTSSRLKKSSAPSTSLRTSLATTILFAAISLIPGAMLFLWWAAILIDVVIQISCLIADE